MEASSIEHRRQSYLAFELLGVPQGSPNVLHRQGLSSELKVSRGVAWSFLKAAHDWLWGEGCLCNQNNDNQKSYFFWSALKSYL